MAEPAPVKPEAIYKFEKLAVSNFPYEPRKRGGYGIFFYEGYGTPLPPTKEQTKFLLEIRRVIMFTYSVEWDDSLHFSLYSQPIRSRILISKQ